MALTDAFRTLLRDPVTFAEHASALKLRVYQQEVARAVARAVLRRQGLSFVVMFPRQSGKNELQAQIEAYLLVLLSHTDAEIIKVSPTWKPQSLNAMRRLERVLQHNLLAGYLEWKKESGYIYRIGRARVSFLSGAPETHIVGATASTLLEVDEAQDVLPAKYDKDIAPMAASTNAVRVFWGTAWTGSTLLARELRAAREAEARDGTRRVFVVDAGRVAEEVPAYGSFVGEQVQRLGRSHPMVKTQFFCEEIDAEGGMFPPTRRALMQGSHAPRCTPEAGKGYAMLIDVAGEDEAAAEMGAALRNPARDATALTVVEIGEESLRDDLVGRPTYRVVMRRAWVGVKHTALYGEIKALAGVWQPRRLVIDATGVGAGLASFLDHALPGKVTPFTFNAAAKSRLGWGFLQIVDSGRFKDCATDHKAAFDRQVEACQYQIVPGPEKRMQWGVPDGKRSPVDGELIHDDLLLSAALCAELDQEEWVSPGAPLQIDFPDPLDEMDGVW